MYSPNFNNLSVSGLYLSILMFLIFLLDPIVASKFQSVDYYYVYALKSVSFLLFLLCMIKTIKSMPVVATLLILFFWFLYSFSGFFQTLSINAYMTYLLSASWYLVCCSIVTILVLGYDEPEELGYLTAKFMLYSGSIFYVLQIVYEEAFNKFLDFPLPFIIGALILYRKNLFLYSILCAIIFLFYYLSENRTGILVLILCIISQSKLALVLDRSAIKLGFLGLAICLTLFYANIESNDLFNNSQLSGRGAIWSYWVDVIQSDLRYLLFGVKYSGVIYDSHVLVGNYQLSPLLAYQFHSAFIAVLVQGGVLILIFSLCFLLYMLAGSKGVGTSVFYYPVLAVLMLNGVNDFFYPNIYGVVFLISVLMCRQGEIKKSENQRFSIL